MIEASQRIVAAIGPWNKERLSPPKLGNIRMSFLVSDGLYFGEGPMGVMQRDALAAPLIAAAKKLLLKIVDQNTVTGSGGSNEFIEQTNSDLVSE